MALRLICLFFFASQLRNLHITLIGYFAVCSSDAYRCAYVINLCNLHWTVWTYDFDIVGVASIFAVRVHCTHLHLSFYFFHDFVHVCRMLFVCFFLCNKMSVTVFILFVSDHEGP